MEIEFRHLLKDLIIVDFSFFKSDKHVVNNLKIQLFQDLF